jgi:hypothetical protein
LTLQLLLLLTLVRYLYYEFILKILNPAGRIPKPSQRLQNIDPLATLTKPTPAPPKATRQKQQSQKPQTPTRQRGPHLAQRPASIHASRQIHKSQNRHAVALLFTPRNSRGRPSQALGAQRQRQQPVSPSPLVRNPYNPTSLHRYNLPDDLEAGSNSDSDQDIQSGIKALNLTSGR